MYLVPVELAIYNATHFFGLERAPGQKARGFPVSRVRLSADRIILWDADGGMILKGRLDRDPDFKSICVHNAQCVLFYALARQT